MHPRASRRLQTSHFEMAEEVELPFRLCRAGKERMQLLRKHLLPVGNRLQPSPIGILQAEDDPDADLLVSLHDRVEVPVLERIEGEHVLDRGDPGTKAFQTAQQCARAHLLDRARRILRRQGIETPALERDLLERAFGQNIVGVVVRVDKSGQDEMPARVQHID